jgi:hypothetical protein
LFVATAVVDALIQVLDKITVPMDYMSSQLQILCCRDVKPESRAGYISCLEAVRITSNTSIEIIESAYENGSNGVELVYENGSNVLLMSSLGGHVLHTLTRFWV